MIYPIRRVVAGIASLDGDDPLLDPAVEIARRAGATLHLVHGYQLPTAPWDAYAPWGVANGELIQQLMESIRQRLETCADRVRDKAEIHTHTVPGGGATAILEAAEEQDADLIVVGPTRHGKLARMILGTTAQRVLHHAKSPVLVLRGALPRRPERLLLATDLSRFSDGIHETGLDIVESLFGDSEPETRALFVTGDEQDLPFPGLRDVVEKAARRRLEEYLEQRRVRRQPAAGVVRYGDPAHEIVAEAGEWNPDLLVIGSHEPKGPVRWLLGSVAEAVTREVKCSVLVVPPGLVEERSLPIPLEETG